MGKEREGLGKRKWRGRGDRQEWKREKEERRRGREEKGKEMKGREIGSVER